MRRNMDIVHNILEEIEFSYSRKHVPDLYTPRPGCTQLSRNVIDFHIDMLTDAKFIKSFFMPSASPEDMEINYKLTWKGHDLLEKLERDKRDPIFPVYRA